MTKPSGKRRHTTGNTGNYSSPRRGEKAKQTKVTPAKESDTKARRQTKISFAPSNTTDNDPSTTIGSTTIKAITPDGRAAARIRHPSPPNSSDKPTPRKITSTTTKNTTNDIPTKKPPPTKSDSHPSNDNAATADAEFTLVTRPPRHKKKATTVWTASQESPSQESTAIDDNNFPPLTQLNKDKTTVPLTQESNATTTTDAPSLTQPKPKRIKKKVTTAPTPSTPNKDQLDTPTPSTPDKPKTQAPLETQAPLKTPENCGSIRYNGFIETPPSEKPFDEFLKIFAAYFKVIQDVLGKDVYLAAWDSEQTQAFPPLKSPKKLPQSRESIGIYLGTYVNPKTEGSKIYLNLRLVTTKAHQVPLARFGMELTDQFASSKHKMSIHRQPRGCQAAKSECVGWLMYSCKSMNSNTFIPAIRKALNIPATVAIGIQFRAIANEHGKKPQYDKENPSAAAIHLDMDERYALVYQARCASLWRKNSKQRLPNGVQLRLVPCFTSATGKSMTEAQRSDAKTLLERQFYFVKEHLRILPPYFFISQLDTPLSAENPMTLRRAMMSRAPAKNPTSRLIHNVDASWNQPAKHVITTVVGREVEAQRFLVNMIPECLHLFGDEASKWFTGSGLMVYKDVKWNPDKGTTTSAKEQESEEMVKEDLWDLTSKWEQLIVTKPTQRPDEAALDGTKPTPTPATNPDAPAPALPEETVRFASDRSIASFGKVYNRPTDDDDIKEAAALAAEQAANPDDLTGTQFEFSTEQLENDRQKAINGPPSTGMSMSTAAKTTPKTRLRLKEAQEEITELKRALAQHAKQNPPTDSQESTDSTPEVTPQPPGNDDMDVDAFTENQALGAAISQPSKEVLEADSDAMEEDRRNPIIIGSSSSDQASDDISGSAPSASVQEEDASMTKSSNSPSSSSDSSSSSSSSSEESLETQDTEDLVNKLTTTNPISKTPSPKNLATLDEHSGSDLDSASHQDLGQDSGSRGAHLPPDDPSGKAGALPQDAGPRV
jgi:hypothetical protein